MLIEVKTKPKSELISMSWDEVNEIQRILPGRHWKHPENQEKAAGYLDPKDMGSACGEPVRWYGAPDKATLFRRLSEGWPEGVDRLSEVELPLIEAKSVRRRRERGDQGDSIDMQSVYRGDLSRAWTRTRKRESSGIRSVSLLINLGASASVSADKLAWRGISALRVCEALTEAGYAVAIYGVEGGTGVEASGKTIDLVQFAEIKAADQPLDLDRLAALTIMPGYFRTTMFAGMALGCDHIGRPISSTLGRPDESRITEALAMQPSMPQRVFLQPKAVLSREKAVEWVAQVVAQIEADDAAEAGEGEE